MKARVTFGFLATLLFLCSQPVYADVINVPADQPTIQAGIDAAVPGDMVLVADGTYKGAGNKNLDFKGKAITVQSQNGPANCIIDCENDGRGFYFNSGEGADSILSGFTITRGQPPFYPGGGGIYCGNASPKIKNCEIIGNSSTGGGAGGGIYLAYGSLAAIEDCTIANNSAYQGGGIYTSGNQTILNCTVSGNSASQGGGIYWWGSSPAIRNSHVTMNSQGGGIYCIYSTPTITNCVIDRNSEGGILCDSSSPTIMNCTITGNTSGAGVGIYGYFGSPSVTNTILWMNSTAEIFTSTSSNPAVTYCDIQGGYPGEGNFHGDPLFVDAENGDYHLSVSSPCMYAGTSEGAPDTDIEGNPRPQGYGYDLGAYQTTGYAEQRPIIDSFVANATQDFAPFDVTFSCTAHDPDGAIMGYTMNYGDDSVPETNTTGVFSHTYDAHGLLYAFITVVDNTGAAVNSAAIRITNNGKLRVPETYPTIQAAVDSAIDGDWVLVTDGTYKGEGNKDLDFKGKAIVVRSENGPENCVIDCEGNGRGFFFHSQEGSDSIVSGFTIMNGQAYSGGGIFCDYSSPTIENCRIIANSAALAGGGIYSGDSTQIRNCVISGNSAANGGGGIQCGGQMSITNCTIVGNSSGGGGVNCSGSPTITNSIVWANTSDQIRAEDSASPVVTYCDVHGGYPGEGNFHGDPLFVDAENGDYHLSVSSPCMNAGTPEGAPDTDIEGNPRPQGYGYDIGAYETTGYVQQRPVIESFTADLIQGTVPFEAIFVCSALDPDGTVVGYSIDYGDSSIRETNSTGVFVHVYTSFGTGDVTCTVEDDSGAETNSFSIIMTRHRIINVPGDYSTIQEAIDIATGGDTIQVADGTYKGEWNKNIDFKGKAITVQSATGPENSVIDCEGEGKGFVFHSGEDQNSVVMGFTIQNCYATGIEGAGIHVGFSSSPHIKNNHIKNCEGWAIGLTGSSPIVEGNTLIRNGGGIILWGAKPTIAGNWIGENTGQGIEAFNTGAFTIVNNLILSNGGDGIKYGIPFGTQEPVEIINNTIVGNSGSGINGNRSEFLKVLNNIVVRNGGYGINFGPDYNWGTPIVDYNNVWGNGYQNYSGLASAGAHDIEADPQVIDFFGGNYHLLRSSPCVDAGTNQGAWSQDFEGQPRPMDGNGDGITHVDIGADELGSPLDHDVALQVIAPTSSESKLGGSFEPIVKVWNIGTNNETGITAKCEIRRESVLIYEQTQLVNALGIMDSAKIVFPVLNPQIAGNYEISLFVELLGDENSSNDSAKRAIEVRELQAEFSFQIIEESSQVNFIDHSVGAVDKWLWDFGDGTASTDQNPVHYYTGGIYTVSLTVWSKSLFDVETKESQLSIKLGVLGMEVGNTWTYQGNYEGAPIMFNRVVAGFGWQSVSFPVQTYRMEIYEEGAWAGSDYYEKSEGQLKLWGETVLTEIGLMTFKFGQGLPVAWFPMAVNDQKALTGKGEFAQFPGFPFDFSFTAHVLSKGPVTLGFDTFEAYEVQYTVRIWGQGEDATDTFSYWLVPYIGVIRESGEGYLFDLSSFRVGGGGITEISDKDSDGLRDYQELFLVGTNWQKADTDGDGLTDGQEDVNANGVVDPGERDPRVKDPAFGPSSADITHSYSPLSANMKLIYAGTGTFATYGRYYQVLGTEVVDSVNCLKVAIKGHGNNRIPDADTEWYYVWFAQDASGVVWVLKHYDALSNTTLELGRADAIVWAPATFAVGQRFEEVGGAYREVVETGVTVNLGTGLGTYTDCVKVKSVEGTDEDFYYMAPNVGIVKEEWNDGGNTNGWELKHILTGAVVDELVLNFGVAYGLWHYAQATGWVQLNTVAPSRMVTADIDNDGVEELVAAFTGYGLYVYKQGSGWTQINTVLPDGMMRQGKGVALNFGTTYGLWYYDTAGGWQQMNSIPPSQVVAVDMDGDGAEELVAAFTGYGLYTYKAGAGWTQINAVLPDRMIRKGSGLVFDYGVTYGLWNWTQAGGWTQINTVKPGHMTAVDLDNDGADEFVACFAGYGLYMYDETNGWRQLNSVVPDAMRPLGKGLALNFGATYGLWYYDQLGGYKQLSTVPPDQMVAMDIDKDGTEELVATFAGYGLYVYDQTNGWSQLNGVIPEDMIPANLSN
jgi:parallel beta-helix repeat protein